MEEALDYAKWWYGEDIVNQVEQVSMYKGNKVFRISAKPKGAIGIIYFVLVNKNGEPRLSTEEEYFEILEKL